MTLIPLGYILLAIAAITMTVILYVLRDKESNRMFEIPTEEEIKHKRWNSEETIIAFYLSKFGRDNLGPIKVTAGQIKRSLSSLEVKIEIFDDLILNNITKNATKLDRSVFDMYSNRSEQMLYYNATNSMNSLV